MRIVIFFFLMTKHYVLEAATLDKGDNEFIGTTFSKKKLYICVPITKLPTVKTKRKIRY